MPQMRPSAGGDMKYADGRFTDFYYPSDPGHRGMNWGQWCESEVKRVPGAYIITERGGRWKEGVARIAVARDQ